MPSPLPQRLVETTDTRSYEWELDGMAVRLELKQHFGRNSAEGILAIEPEEDYIVQYGRDGGPEYREIRCGRVATLPDLDGRGATYWLIVRRADGGAASKLHFRTLLRYPYGRDFASYRQALVRKPDESRIVLYWEEDADIAPYKRLLVDTAASDYLEHIVQSVAPPSMSPMERAKAIIAFLGGAMQHNAVYLNKRDSIPAMERFLQSGCEAADVDYETVLNLELGFTRCGFINGFMLAALCRRIGLRNEVFFSNGGHTSGKIAIDGNWYLADPDAFKQAYPLTDDGSLPPLDWLYEGNNRLLLDTVPGWEDSNPEEGWIAYGDGFRVTGVIGGGRHHAETGYVSSWYGAPLAYPPSVPKALPVRYRRGTRVLLEWIGSYDRDGDFRDYRVEIGSDRGLSDIGEWTTPHTWLEIDVPQSDRTYYWRVRARDFHGEETAYDGKVYYTPSPEQTIAPHERDASAACAERVDEATPLVDDCPDSIRFIDAAKPDGGLSDFTRLEGFDDVLGQTNLARTELFHLKMGKAEKPLLRLVDPTNYWFNGFMCRSLWVRPIVDTAFTEGDWTFSLIIELRKDGFGGERHFPLVWLGERGAYTGIGLMLDCCTGELHFAANLFGDWRKGPGIAATGKPERFDIVWSGERKTLRYIHEGHEVGTEDCGLRGQTPVAIDSLFIASNPEGELDCLFHHLQLAKTNEL